MESFRLHEQTKKESRTKQNSVFRTFLQSLPSRRMQNYVLREKSAWCKSGIAVTDFYMFMLGSHRYYPEWHLSLLVLVNHWSWPSSISPVRQRGGSVSEACALNPEQMKHCSLLQSMVELDIAWSPSIAFWHLWVPQVLWPQFTVPWREGGCVLTWVFSLLVAF